MKWLALLSCIAVLAFAQTNISPDHDHIHITADRQESNGSMTHLSGHVKFETDSFVLLTEQADFNQDTAEIVAHGDVKVTLKP